MAVFSSSTTRTKHHDADQRQPLPGRVGNEERERHGQEERDQLLAKGLLAARRGEQAVPGIDGGAQQSFHGRPVSAEVRLQPSCFGPIYCHSSLNPASPPPRADGMPASGYWTEMTL